MNTGIVLDPTTTAVAQLSAQSKMEIIEEKESAFAREFGEKPSYSTLKSGVGFSVEIINSKYPAKEYGDCVFDAKIAALKKALKDIEDE